MRYASLLLLPEAVGADLAWRRTDPNVGGMLATAPGKFGLAAHGLKSRQSER
jgi:hypothetical protein